MSEHPIIDEPPVEEDDTRPRAPVPPTEAVPGWLQPHLPAQEPPHDAVPDWLHERLVTEKPPRDSLVDTAEVPVARPPGRPLLLLVIMAGTLCLCLTLVAFAGYAGYRDGLATNDARITQTLATGIAQQYATGVADLQQGYAELAAARFAWIVETIQAPPEYALDSEVQLAMARTIAAYTPTPSVTPTLTPSPSPSPAPTIPPSPTVEPSPTLDALSDPAYLYDQAATAMRVAHYEDAIEWLDALAALAPDYRASEVKAMLMEALTTQGGIYLAGANEDGEDMLARGVLLIYRAHDLGTVEPDWLYGQAIFVESYINARSYVNGGNYAQALPILNDLCSINCDWTYHGVSVRALQEKAAAGGTN